MKRIKSAQNNNNIKCYGHTLVDGDALIDRKTICEAFAKPILKSIFTKIKLDNK